jgi:hypothetical protein
MTCPRVFFVCMLVLAAMVFSISEVMGADDYMVLRFRDGSTQRIKLERPSELIRQIEFLEGRGMSDRDRKRGPIKVISATYGENCRVPHGNVTDHLAEACNGKMLCEYVIDHRVIGDPAPDCRKNYIAEWQCGSDPDRGVVRIPFATNGTSIELSCPVR